MRPPSKAASSRSPGLFAECAREDDFAFFRNNNLHDESNLRLWLSRGNSDSASSFRSKNRHSVFA